MAVTFEEGGRERVLLQAMDLAGTEERARAETLLDGLTALATAACGREYISRPMEGTLAVLLSRQLDRDGGRGVSSVKRGDTTITYEESDGGEDMGRLLAPFVHLRTPRGRWRE